MRFQYWLIGTIKVIYITSTDLEKNNNQSS